MNWILFLFVLLCITIVTIDATSVTCDLSYVSYNGNYNDNQIPYTTDCGNRLRPVITVTFNSYAYHPYVTSGWGPNDINNYPFKFNLLAGIVARMSIVNLDTNQLFFPTYTYGMRSSYDDLGTTERSFIRSSLANGDPLAIRFDADMFFSGTWQVSYTESYYATPANGVVYVSIGPSDSTIPNFSCILKANQTILAAVSDPVVGQNAQSFTQYNILMFSNPVKKCTGSGPINGTDIGYPFSDQFIPVSPDAQGYATSWYTTTNSARVVAAMCGSNSMNVCDRYGNGAIMGFTYRTTMYSQPAIVVSENCVAGTYDSISSGWLLFGFGNAFISLDDPLKQVHAIRRLPFVLNRTLVNDFYRTNMTISPFTGVGQVPSVTHAVTGISDSTTCWNYSTIGFSNSDGVCYNSTCDPVFSSLSHSIYINYYSYIISAKKYIHFDGSQYYTRINITSSMRVGDSPPIQVFTGRYFTYTVLYYTLIAVNPPTIWDGQFDGQSLFVNDQQVLPYYDYYNLRPQFVYLYTYTSPVPITLYNTSLVSMYNVSIATYSELRFYCTWCETDPILAYSVNASAFRLRCEQDTQLTYLGCFGTYLSFSIGATGCQNRSVVLAFVDTNAYHTSYRIPQTQSSIVATPAHVTYITMAALRGGRILSVLCLNCITDLVTGVNDTFWSLTCNGTSVTSLAYQEIIGAQMQFAVVGCTQLQNIMLTVRDGAYHTTLAASLPQTNVPVDLTVDFGLANAYLLDNTYLILQFNNTGILDSSNFNLTRVTLTCYNLTATLGSPVNSFGYNNQTRISITGNCNNVTTGGVSLTLQAGAVSDIIELSVNTFTGPLSISSVVVPPILSSSCLPGPSNTSNVTMLIKSSGFNLVTCQSCSGYGLVSSCNWKNPSNITFVYTGRDRGCVNLTVVSTQLANTVLNQAYTFDACPFVNLVDAVYTPFAIQKTRLKFDEYTIADLSVIQSQINFSCGGVPFTNLTYAGVNGAYLVYVMNASCVNDLQVSIAAYSLRTVDGLWAGPVSNYPVLTDRTSVTLSSCVPGNEISTEFLTVNLTRGVVLTGAAVAPPCTETNHTADGQTFYLPGKLPGSCQLNYGFCNQFGDKYNQSLVVALCPIDKSIVQVNYTCTPNSTTSSLLTSYFLGRWSYASILQTQGNCSNPRISRYDPPEIETFVGGTTQGQFCTITYVILNAADQLVLFNANYTICPLESREPDFNELSLGMVLLMSFLTLSLLTLYYLYRAPPAAAHPIPIRGRDGYEQVVELY